MSQFVRVVRAHESETLECQWRLNDGSVHIERYTVLPSVPLSALQGLLKEWQDTGDSMQALIDLELLCERAIDAQEPTP